MSHSPKDYLITLAADGMAGLLSIRPFGVKLSEMFNHLLIVANGSLLDQVIEMHLKLYRYKSINWTVMLESDENFRERAKQYSYILDRAIIVTNTPKEQHTHIWKMYHGFTDQYEYCEKCDVRK